MPLHSAQNKRRCYTGISDKNASKISTGSRDQEMDRMVVSLKRDHLINILSVIVIYVATIVIVHPLNDFPLMDDWSYARAVHGLVEHGDWRPTGFTTASLITQSLWGAIFCFPLGFSFDALRLSTI